MNRVLPFKPGGEKSSESNLGLGKEAGLGTVFLRLTLVLELEWCQTCLIVAASPAFRGPRPPLTWEISCRRRYRLHKPLGSPGHAPF